jgi:hypothetical protein
LAASLLWDTTALCGGVSLFSTRVLDIRESFLVIANENRPDTKNN